MAYDALDRLLSAASPIFGNNTTGTATFSYDALDNLMNLAMPATNTSPARNQFYCYDANWRLASLRDADGCAGTAQVNLAYDAQGNLASKGSQAFAFGKNNRLYAAPAQGEVYRYDAQGHRVLQNAAAGNILSQYARDGQLLQVTNVRSGFTSSYISLGGSLVAVRKKALSGGTITVEYQHTDALGTPVAVTDANRNVIERSEYEPYGQLHNRPITDGPGFTGHVQDALTGLTYMQQRYFDPMIGRFLSVDPVTATSTGGNFNRYWYANDNPYRFKDPDGRKACGKNTTCQLEQGATGGTVRVNAPIASDKQREMVKVAVDGKGSPDEAADAFGRDTQEEAKNSKREPQTGIVKTEKGYGYTEPMWGDPNKTTVDVGEYSDALLAVYGANYLGFAHGHFDDNYRFSPIDLRPFLSPTGFSRSMYVHVQNGRTYRIDTAILKNEVRNAGFKQDLDEFMSRAGGAQGVCVGGC